MTTRDIRQSFVDFFRSKGHRIVPSSSLVPENDPSVLLTTAGMQQFKPYFLGQKDAEADFGSRRLTSIQRCFRTSDIDEVGDASHNTFFEMLGNFSIGDYFKAEAIAYAWEYLTVVLRLPPERLWVTVFAGDAVTPRDQDAEKLWLAYVPVERLSANGRADNFWGPSGTTGPCGPSSELHYDRTQTPCGRGTACRPNCDCGRFLEIWNLVFTEWDKIADGTFVPLKAKNIDTGMGLERLALVVQNVPTIFETDLFTPVLAAVRQVAPVSSTDDEAQLRTHRCLADHLRAATWLLADGVTFSNKDQGYILRRIVRRALDLLPSVEVDLAPVIDAVRQTYAGFALIDQAMPVVLAAMRDEQQAYRRVLQQDVTALVQRMRGRGASAGKELTPEEVFILYSTHGLSWQRLEKEGYRFDRPSFDQLVAEHQTESRRGAEKKFGGHGLAHGITTAGHSEAAIHKITRLHSATHLLHAALRSVLGPQVRQNGSDITPERLRFDFAFPRKLTDEERQRVEAMVNEKIEADLPIHWEMLPYEQAIAQGALAFFKEKYDPVVKVYSMGDFSKELCGGPHVAHTAEVGHFSILSEKSIAAGMRRIKAVVADPA